MADPPSHPTLTPRFCFDQRALRDFLRLSRALDDSITSTLNTLLTPSTLPFDPSRPRPRSSRSATIPASTCDRFAAQILFPAWRARADVLSFCGAVASAPDQNGLSASQPPQPFPRDGEQPQQKELAPPPWQQREGDARWDEGDSAAAGKARVAAWRADQYSSRDLPVGEGKREELGRVVRNELSVERIVRARSWGVVKERCELGGEGVVGSGLEAEEAFEEWRRKEGS